MIAVLVFTHKNLKQTKRLIESLKHPSIDIYLHVDSKCCLNIDFSDVYLLDRHDVKWSGSSQVDAVFQSLKEISFIKNYDYYIFMSGQDYLIKPIDQIVKYLSENKGSEFLDYKEIINKNVAARYLEYHTKNRYINAILRRIMPKRKLFNGMKTYYGSCWWMLTEDAVKYMISEYDKKYFKKLYLTNCIDEVIYQTILLNSSFASSIVNDNKWYIDWSDHKKGLNDGNPNILMKKDYNKIIDSDKFFARKFDMCIDSEILNMLDNYREEL